MNIYAFGSICRGEIDAGSDIDILICTDESTHNLDPEKFSIYTYDRIKTIWAEGNPFSWHLHLESKLVYSSDGSDFFKCLGIPSVYTNSIEDHQKFKKLFESSLQALKEPCGNSSTFHISCIFLAIRNMATCYSLEMGTPIFSRNSPLLVNPHLNISNEVFSIFTRSRLLSTRGHGQKLTFDEISEAIDAAQRFSKWIEMIEEKLYERA